MGIRVGRKRLFFSLRSLQVKKTILFMAYLFRLHDSRVTGTEKQKLVRAAWTRQCRVQMILIDKDHRDDAHLLRN